MFCKSRSRFQHHRGAEHRPGRSGCWRNGGFSMGGSLIVTGGRPLCGRARVPAAKKQRAAPAGGSAAVRRAGLPAGCSAPVRCGSLPDPFAGVGCAAVWQGEDLVIRGGPCRCASPKGPAAQMRASILFCAPLLAGWDGLRPCCLADAGSGRGPSTCTWRDWHRWATTR